jgi:hypothetical protein
MDAAMPLDRKVKHREGEKKLKYKSLSTESQRI